MINYESRALEKCQKNFLKEKLFFKKKIPCKKIFEGGVGFGPNEKAVWGYQVFCLELDIKTLYYIADFRINRINEVVLMIEKVGHLLE